MKEDNYNDETDENLDDIDIDMGDDNSELIIEIDEDDKDDLFEKKEKGKATKKVEEDEDDDIAVLSKHKVEDKHKLSHDSIFKGKKEDPVSEDDPDNYTDYFKDTIEVDRSSSYHHESINNEIYIRNKEVKMKVYDVLKEHTDLNFLNNRRKPSRVDFNIYYNLLLEKLVEERFTNVELFNELSVYFSDNLFNMFKLLDNKWRDKILAELESHIGKNTTSKEITNRNIYVNTELEFEYINELGDIKLITGIVLETYYETSEFKVDSYENIYMVDISSITEILNNTKLKYNLSRLNTIDFL